MIVYSLFHFYKEVYTFSQVLLFCLKVRNKTGIEDEETSMIETFINK